MKTTEVRASNVEAAIHSAKIEGLQITSATLTDADAYVAGTIDSSELVNRVRTRYGLS
ncbi:hypothetical protein [Microbacterium schleiferi]|uniref:antitoxin VbhA family protein n=1 Tax=Microbacterium schleiferi TaxID=69362 RepID=UPI00311F3BF1